MIKNSPPKGSDKESSLPAPNFPSTFLPDLSIQDSIPKDSQLYSVEDLERVYSKAPRSEIVYALHHNEGPFKSTRTYQIYTINSLPKLLAVLKEKYKASLMEVKHSDNDVEESFENDVEEYFDGGYDAQLPDEAYENMHRIRYLLTENGELLFAEEGSEPPHFAMTGETKNPQSSRCVCAGNLEFNDTFTKIRFVSNKSGDFHPEDALLKKVYAALIALADHNLLELEGDLKIEHHRDNSSYEVSVETLRSFVYQEFSEDEREEFVKVNQKAEHRVVVREPSLPVEVLPDSEVDDGLAELQETSDRIVDQGYMNRFCLMSESDNFLKRETTDSASSAAFRIRKRQRAAADVENCSKASSPLIQTPSDDKSAASPSPH